MLKKIAENIINHSLGLKPGEKLNIIINGESQNPLGREIERVANENGIQTRYGFDNIGDFETFTEEELSRYTQQELTAMKWCDACAILRDFSAINLSERAREKREKFFKIVHENVRFKKRWNITSLPNRKNFKTEQDYEDILGTYIKACSIDYNILSNSMDSLVQRLIKANMVRIIAKGTDLSFSIKDLPAIKCIGKRNLPDGEVYVAPVKNSVNGYITYNFPSLHNGILHNNIHFEFKDGKIVNESSDHTEELTRILNTDEGSRYIGEFSFGLNPFIKKNYNNDLYDEKISGTIHFTPGFPCSLSNNGNKSIIHWDIIQSHNPDHGGGEIWLDDELIRKDGLFVPDYLKQLNPTNLISEFEAGEDKSLNQ